MHKADRQRRLGRPPIAAVVIVWVLLLPGVRAVGAFPARKRKIAQRDRGARPSSLFPRVRRHRLVLTLPWTEHITGGEIPKFRRMTTDRTKNPKMVRRVSVIDGVIDNTQTSDPPGGTFKRTIRVLELKTSGREPLPRQGEVLPSTVLPWTHDKELFLYTDEDLGPSLTARKATLRLFNPFADSVEVVVQGGERISMKPQDNGVWSATLKRGRRELHGKEYSFNVRRADAISSKQLADPMAHFVEYDKKLGRTVSRFADLTFSWGDSRFRPPPLHSLVIYEAHLPTLSRHREAPVEHAVDRGTYRGARAPLVLEHLRRLGVALEVLPLHAFDEMLGGLWGYWSRSWQAIAPRDTNRSRAIDANREVMALINSAHRKNIPIIVDVVYNHGGEVVANMLGRDMVLRASEDSGCGRDVCTERPMMRRMILSSLKRLVEDFHVDGFRFDLGALLDKRTMLSIDEYLPDRIYLFAEPWSATGATKWGKRDLLDVFRKTRWVVWNDDFREPARAFITSAGHTESRDRLRAALVGNPVEAGSKFPWADHPQRALNYLSSHDGQTLADFVGGHAKRHFLGLGLVLMAQGIPMIAAGSEAMRSTHGEENGWNRPESNILDWGDITGTHRDLVKATADLIALRKKLPHFTYRRHLRHDSKARVADYHWIYPTGYPHDDNHNAIGIFLRPPHETTPLWRSKPLIMLFNGSHQHTTFNLPRGSWHVLVDGKNIKVDPRGLRHPPAQGDYAVEEGTFVVLAEGTNSAG